MKVVDGQKYKETERNEQIENNQFNSKGRDTETDKEISQIQKGSKCTNRENTQTEKI